MSNKLWVVRICAALSVLCLFIASSYAFYLWQQRVRFVSWFWRPLELWVPYWLSALLLIIAGVLLGISPEVFFNLKNIGFRPAAFIISAAIPISVLIFISYELWSGYWWRLWMLPDYIGSYISLFGQWTSSIWLGVAIGKAIHVRRGQGRARTTMILR